MVRVSAAARTAQEANQLGGAVILPLIFLALGQATGLLLVDAPGPHSGVGARMGGGARASGTVRGGIAKFTRDRIARGCEWIGGTREHEELQHRWRRGSIGTANEVWRGLSSLPLPPRDRMAPGSLSACRSLASSGERDDGDLVAGLKTRGRSAAER